jgi:hypothetical protein
MIRYRNISTNPRRRGMAYILAVAMLCVLAALAVAYAATTGTNLRTGRNMSEVQAARMNAEGGLSYMLRQLRALQLDPNTTAANAITNLGASLSTAMNGTANLGGQAIGVGTSVTMPPINLDYGSFDAAITKDGNGNLFLAVNGHANGINRTVQVGLSLTSNPPNSAFNYGIASRGSISVGGNSQILGKSVASDASVISTTAGATAITVAGSAVIGGDLSSVGPTSTVVLSGNPTIAGSQDPQVIAQHVHFGVDPPIFPVVDPTVFKPLATGGVIDSHTNTRQKDAVFNNVVIKANTNPTFSSDVTLNGVVYIEAPNCVTFTSKVTLNGLVATDNGANSGLSNCRISFQGQVESFGVDALPNTSQFAAVKQLTGTFIAAPGFDVSFAGQFTTINGTVAADKLTFSGQSGGTIKGSVLGLSDAACSIEGTVDIYIDRETGSGTPDAGFKMPVVVNAVQGSFQDVTGS